MQQQLNTLGVPGKGVRTTEQIAPEFLLKLTAELSRLTTDQPTTAELEEALVELLPSLASVLRTWISSRHLIAAHAHQAAEFRERHPRVAAALCRVDLSSPFVQTRPA